MKVEDRGVKPPLPRRGGTPRGSQSRSLQRKLCLQQASRTLSVGMTGFGGYALKSNTKTGMACVPPHAPFTGTVAMFTPASQTRAR